MVDWGQLVEVRPLDRARPGELACVLRSWIMSWSPHAQPPLTPAQADPIVEQHLERCDLVLVATVPGVERTVCGWVARLAPGTIAYLYVMHDYRRRGIGARLLRAAGIDPRGARWRYVFPTPRMRRLCRPDPKRPGRIPWKGVSDDGKASSSRSTPARTPVTARRWPR